MPRKTDRDVEIDSAWELVLDRLPALNNFVDNIDQVRDAVAAAAELAVKELEKAIAAGVFPKHWQNPTIELRPTGYAVRMAMSIPEVIHLPSIEIDTRELPSFRLGDVLDLSQVKLGSHELIPVDSAVLERARRPIRPVELDLSLPLAWLLKVGATGFVTDTLLQCVRILVHAHLLEEALLASNATAASMHTLSLASSALRLALLPHKRALGGIAKARAGARENYGGQEKREQRDDKVRAAIYSAYRQDSSRGITKLLRAAHTDLVNGGLKISFGSVERIARESQIKATTIAALALDPGHTTKS